MSDALSSRLLEAIAADMTAELDVLVERATGWQFAGGDDDLQEARCLACGHREVGGEDAADAAMRAHLQECQPTKSMLICQAHREIVETYQRLSDPAPDEPLEHFAQRVTLMKVVILLARAYCIGVAQ